MDTEEKLGEKVLGAMSGVPKSSSGVGMVPVSDTNNQPVGKSMFADGSHKRTEKYQDANGNSIVKTYERKGNGLVVPHGFSALDYGDTSTQPRGNSGVAPLLTDSQKEEKYIKSLSPDQLAARDRYQEDYKTGPFAVSNRVARSEANQSNSINDRMNDLEMRKIGLAREFLSSGGSLDDFNRMAGTSYGGNGVSGIYDNSGQINSQRANIDYWDRQARNIVGNPKYTASAARAALSGLNNAKEALVAEQIYETGKTNAGTGLFNAQTGRLSAENAAKLGLDRLGLANQEMLMNNEVAKAKLGLAEKELGKPILGAGYSGGEHVNFAYDPVTGEAKTLYTGAIPKADTRLDAAKYSGLAGVIQTAVKNGDLKPQEGIEMLNRISRGENVERPMATMSEAEYVKQAMKYNPGMKESEIKKEFSKRYRPFVNSGE
jgi:hypothetical protein